MLELLNEKDILKNYRYYWVFKGKKEYKKKLKEFQNLIINTLNKKNIKFKFSDNNLMNIQNLFLSNFFIENKDLKIFLKILNKYHIQNKSFSSKYYIEYKRVLIKIVFSEKELNKKDYTNVLNLIKKILIRVKNKLIINLKKLIFFFYNIFNNKYLSYSEFRNLQLIDLNNELDIFYRYEHFKIVTNNFKYLKIGEIIDFYKNNENFKTLQSKIKDPINIDLKTDYPRHCDYFFWKNGNSFFANNLIYGFKLNIKDYESVQKMKTAKGLILFSKNYYDYHQEMSENEINNIFIKQPIRINNNIILNGRHRVCAMIGRILKNEKYINIKYVGLN